MRLWLCRPCHDGAEEAKAKPRRLTDWQSDGLSIRETTQAPNVKRFDVWQDSGTLPHAARDTLSEKQTMSYT